MDTVSMLEIVLYPFTIPVRIQKGGGFYHSPLSNSTILWLCFAHANP